MAKNKQERREVFAGLQLSNSEVQLQVLGLPANIIQDDTIALLLETAYLQEHHNASELLLDRFDVRLLVDDLAKLLSKKQAPAGEYFEDVSEEELDYERYYDLFEMGELPRPFFIVNLATALFL